MYIEKILKNYQFFIGNMLQLLLILIYIYFLQKITMVFVIKRSMLALLVALDMLLIVQGLIMPTLWEC